QIERAREELPRDLRRSFHARDLASITRKASGDGDGVPVRDDVEVQPAHRKQVPPQDGGLIDAPQVFAGSERGREGRRGGQQAEGGSPEWSHSIPPLWNRRLADRSEPALDSRIRRLLLVADAHGRAEGAVRHGDLDAARLSDRNGDEGEGSGDRTLLRIEEA